MGMVGSLVSGGLGMVGSIGGGIMNAMYNHRASKAQEKYYKQQAEYAKQQAKQAEEQARRVAMAKEVQAQETARRARIEDRKRLEAQRAFMAGNGYDINIGTAMQIQEDNDIISRLNTLDIFKQGQAEGAEIRYAGAQKKRDLLWEAENYRYKADLTKDKRKFDDAFAVVNIMTGAGQQIGKMADTYNTYKQKSVNGYSNYNMTQNRTGTHKSSFWGSFFNN